MIKSLDIIECAQDQRSLVSALLVIQEALETGVMPKSFLIYNDESIGKTMSHIASLMKEKYNIKVPDSEI